MKCPSCGQEHDQELTAALAFQDIARMIAQRTDMYLCPQVILHVTGLLGALLVRYSGFEFSDVLGEIARQLENEPALAKLHERLLEVGMIDPDGDMNPGGSGAPH